jgi:hypothetical protein
MAAEQKTQANGSKEKASYTVQRYGKSRYWQVTDAAGELICLTVYKRGANEVARRLAT